MKESFSATGRRKEAKVKVVLKAGKGNFTVNKKTIDEYFPRLVYRKVVKEALEKVNFVDQFDVEVQASGGGLAGQAEAIRLGISRAILEINPELRPPLKKSGFLTRDPRMKERKKPGLRGARARPQSSKR
ncbi:30S ribosomal protein S9 [Candidatus Aerophobetes bacterium]|uniref:Small ribosomal subunit protein uS9 n=1 Tax=Aerophobetes bacterium TaxID=2030807 RepID=A0A523WDY2_UNCAE|nr:MAG: 30S ribosomal protein S9 [Candidatus Aerophobetes bacterium]